MLLVHGLSGETAWLTPYVKALMAEHPDMSFVAIELPEVGHSINKPDGERFSRQTIRKVTDTIDALSQQAGRPIFLSGISLGGLISTRATARRKKQVAGLALVSPAFSPSRHLMAKGMKDLTGKSLLKAPAASGIEAESSQNLTAEQRAIRVAKERADREKELDKASNLKVLLNMQLAQYWDAFRLNPPLPGFLKRLLGLKRIPVISFATQRDEVVSFDAVRRFMRRIRSSHTFTTYNQSAHNLSLDPQLPDMARRIGEWLNVYRSL